MTLFVATAVATLWSLIAGAAGTALVIAWLFTKHYFMSRNENLLHFDPLSLALVVLVPLSVYGMRGVSVDGMDPFAVYDAVEESVAVAL